MLRIVGLNRSANPEDEFILFQNQGQLRVVLRGYVVMSESMIESHDACEYMHLFRDDEAIPTGMYVMLSTGKGQPGWRRTRDGALVFHTYMNKEMSVWEDAACPFHVLAPQHAYAARNAMISLK